MIFNVSYSYGHTQEQITDPANIIYKPVYGTIPGVDDHFKYDTQVIAETLPEAIQKVYQKILDQELVRHEYAISNARAMDKFPPKPRNIVMREIHIKQSDMWIIE